MLWNANNSYRLDRINWGALGYVAEITTVSRYIGHLMARWGVNPLVVSNGIPEAASVRRSAGIRRSTLSPPCAAAVSPLGC